MPIIDQHENIQFKHPHGGQAKFLESALKDRYLSVMEGLARNAITADGSDLHSAMERGMEGIAELAAKRAPVEFGDLKASMSPSVTDNGRVVYSRPPLVHRLTAEELRAKSAFRRLRPR